MTTLVLPPYSAGGAPEMTSIDWTESSGSWFEKTLLCWSVIGLAVDGERILRVVAQPVEQAIGIGGDSRR